MTLRLVASNGVVIGTPRRRAHRVTGTHAHRCALLSRLLGRPIDPRTVSPSEREEMARDELHIRFGYIFPASHPQRAYIDEHRWRSTWRAVENEARAVESRRRAKARSGIDDECQCGGPCCDDEGA